MSCVSCLFFFFKQKTAYGCRISDWSSDVCSSDLMHRLGRRPSKIDHRRIEAREDHHLGRRPGDCHIETALAALASQRAEVHRHSARPRVLGPKLGRASCRERVCQYVSISVVAVSLNKTTKPPSQNTTTPTY